MRCITLTTDFGLEDSYVGQMKGSILTVAPRACIVDLCHAIPPQDVATGAYVLETGYAAFPPGTVHVAVVDPGVGTDRGRLVVETERYVFVAPDNGLLDRALARERDVRAFRISAVLLPPGGVSATFEGRDVFAPVAARVAAGTAPAACGEPTALRASPAPPSLPAAVGAPARIPVVHVDRFGNVVVDLTLEQLLRWLGREPDEPHALRLLTPRGVVGRFVRTFAEGRPEEPLLLVNSAGYLEIAVRGGRADRTLALDRGSVVELVPGG